MDLSFSSEEESFRKDVAAFLQDRLTASIRNKVTKGLKLSREDYLEWHSILAEQNWLAGHWPKEHGGSGWNVVQRFIFDNEAFLANAPRIIPFGVNMLGPVLIKYGTKTQKENILPRMLDGSDWWCQGFSEPGAGSDLASLKTRAVRDGDHYIVNGQKTWTTLGHYANWIFCLVRTDNTGKKQNGISFLLIDMNTPGVELRPILTLDGAHEVNDVFFTNVRVPIENLVGEEHKGWAYAKYLLSYERTGLATVGYSISQLKLLKEMAENQVKRGKPLAKDPLFARRIAKLEIHLEALKTTNLRVISNVAEGTGHGAESAMLKILGSDIRQEAANLMRMAVGSYALPHVPEALDDGYNAPPIGPDYANGCAPHYLNSRKVSIFGGSTEIQKNIIGKMMLGL